MPLPDAAATPDSSLPGSALQCIRPGAFCFRRLLMFRRPASRLLSTLCRHIPAMPYPHLRYSFPGTVPRVPPAWFCPFPMVQKRALLSPDTPCMHSAESGTAVLPDGAPGQEGKEKQLHTFQFLPDTTCRRKPLHDFAQSHGRMHKDALLLSHRSGGSPILLLYETPADRPDPQSALPPLPAICRRP